MRFSWSNSPDGRNADHHGQGRRRPAAGRKSPARGTPQKGGRYWVLPGGGVEPGESAVRALIREFQEELGLPVKVRGFLFCDEVLLPEKHNIDLYFLVKPRAAFRVRLGKDPVVKDFGLFTARGTRSADGPSGVQGYPEKHHERKENGGIRAI